jgi:cytochrome c-type biogenesis protein CcmH
MGPFLFAATALIVASLLLLLRPWRRPVEAGRTAAQVRSALYAEQLRELDGDLAAGTLAAADHAQAREELQRRLLQEVAGDASTAPSSPAGGRASLLIAVAVPLAATGLYGMLGTPEAILRPVPTQAAAMPPDVERMVAGLAARLERNPDDPKGWAMLARSYEVMGRHAEAQAAWARAAK